MPCSCEALWNNSFIPFWFQDEELVDAKLSTSDYCRRVSCHGMSHYIASHILLSRYMSHSHIILLSRYMYHIKTRNTTLLPQPPPPPPKPAGLSLTANLFIVTPPPLGSNVHVYIFLRASLVGGNNFGLPFWVHSSPHVTCKPKLRIIQIRNTKHEKVTKPRIEGKKQSSSK